MQSKSFWIMSPKCINVSGFYLTHFCFWNCACWSVYKHIYVVSCLGVIDWNTSAVLALRWLLEVSISRRPWVIAFQIRACLMSLQQVFGTSQTYTFLNRVSDSSFRGSIKLVHIWSPECVWLKRSLDQRTHLWCEMKSSLGPSRW